MGRQTEQTFLFKIDGLPDNSPVPITQTIKQPGPDGEAMDTGHAYGDGLAWKATSKVMHLNSGDALKGDKRGGLFCNHKVQVAFA
jgi:hypothetical protein